MRNSGETQSAGEPFQRPGGVLARASVDLGLFVAAVVWGLNFVVVKAALRDLEPLAFNALRFSFAAAAVWLLLRAQGRRLLPPSGEWLPVLALGLVGHVGFQISFIFGLDATLAGNAAILLSTSPAWVVAISLAAGRERFSFAVVVGVAATLTGMVVLVGGAPAEVGATSWAGDLLVLVAAATWAVYTVFGQRLTERRGALEVSAWTLWAGVPFIVAAGVPDLVRTDWSTLSPGAWLGVVYAGVFAIGVAYPLWYRGVTSLGQSRTAVYQNLVPVVALASGWLLLAEAPSLQQAIGAGVILIGVVVARRSRRRRRRRRGRFAGRSVRRRAR